MANDQSPTGRTDEAIEFLAAFHPAGPWHLVAILEGGSVDAVTFNALDRERAHAWIEQRQGRANLYFHVATLKEGVSNRKATKEDVLACPCLHVDIDRAEALDALRTFEPAPTAVVWSGNGAHAYWRLQEAVPPERAESFNLALASKLGGDHCHNADRIMRLPGTLNVPDARKRKKGRQTVNSFVVDEMTDFTRTFRPEDFAAVELSSRRASPRTLAVEDIRPVEVDSLRVGDFTKALIRLGDHPHRPMGSPNAAYPSRSEAVFRVTCDLVRAGCPAEEIASILTDPNLGISASIREKRNPSDYATRQIRAAERAVSDDWPDRTRDGHPRATYRNTVLALQRLGLSFSHDEFHRKKAVGGHQIQDLVGDLTDDGCARLRDVIIEIYEFDPGKDHVRDAANALCLQNSYHPVRDYLGRLTWDGVPRLDGWLVRYFGAEDTPLNRAIGAITLIAAVRRVRVPGAKFDTIMVLEGKQGTGKSQALSILAGQDNFSDQDILALDQKAQMEAMVGVWIFEIGELEGLSRADTTKVKAFASRSFDKARPAYGRFTETWPRQCIFVGTTNDDRYLRDITGNRRFWPVRTGVIDLDALRADRDQIWAEAAMREARGESIFLAEPLWADAQAVQESRLEEDPWIDSLSQVQADRAGEWERISTLRLLEELKFDPKQTQNHHTKRLAGVMRKLGWAGPRPVKIKGQLVRGYERRIDNTQPKTPTRRRSRKLPQY